MAKRFGLRAFSGISTKLAYNHAWLRTRFRLTSIALEMLNITIPSTVPSVVMCMLLTMLHLDITRNLVVCKRDCGKVHAIDVLRPGRVAVDNPLSLRTNGGLLGGCNRRVPGSRIEVNYRLCGPVLGVGIGTKKITKLINILLQYIRYIIT